MNAAAAGTLDKTGSPLLINSCHWPYHECVCHTVDWGVSDFSTKAMVGVKMAWGQETSMGGWEGQHASSRAKGFSQRTAICGENQGYVPHIQGQWSYLLHLCSPVTTTSFNPPLWNVAKRPCFSLGVNEGNLLPLLCLCRVSLRFPVFAVLLATFSWIAQCWSSPFFKMMSLNRHLHDNSKKIWLMMTGIIPAVVISWDLAIWTSLQAMFTQRKIHKSGVSVPLSFVAPEKS